MNAYRARLCLSAVVGEDALVDTAINSLVSMSVVRQRRVNDSRRSRKGSHSIAEEHSGMGRGSPGRMVASCPLVSVVHAHCVHVT